jgi:hypothetical protein
MAPIPRPINTKWELRDKGYITPCWIWLGRIKKDGYGQQDIEGKGKYAHIVMYIMHKADIPGGLELDHLCKIKCCVNPDHLEPVTHSENIRRSRIFELTPAKIAEIKELRTKHSVTAIAKMLRLSRPTIYVAIAVKP